MAQSPQTLQFRGILNPYDYGSDYLPESVKSSIPERAAAIFHALKRRGKRLNTIFYV